MECASHSTTRSSSFLLARLAGEKMTTSSGMARAITATKMATLHDGSDSRRHTGWRGQQSYLNVLPKRRGVEIMTSENFRFQPIFSIIFGA